MSKPADKKQVTKFVEAVSAKSYSKANKYLAKIVEQRLKERISTQLDKPLF